MTSSNFPPCPPREQCWCRPDWWTGCGWPWRLKSMAHDLQFATLHVPVRTPNACGGKEGCVVSVETSEEALWALGPPCPEKLRWELLKGCDAGRCVHASFPSCAQRHLQKNKSHDATGDSLFLSLVTPPGKHRWRAPELRGTTPSSSTSAPMKGKRSAAGCPAPPTNRLHRRNPRPNPFPCAEAFPLVPPRPWILRRPASPPLRVSRRHPFSPSFPAA